MPVHSTRMYVLAVSLVALLSPVGAMQDDGAGQSGPLADGAPLQGEQFPRFLSPTHEGEFGFDDFLVLGDYPTINIERRDLDEESGFSLETWARVASGALGGRRVSVFRPAWTAEQLRGALRAQRWGVDRPSVLWGEVVVPGAGMAGRRRLYLQLAPTNVPVSRVVQVSPTMQYASHAVNIWLPGFGESRIKGGEMAVDLAAVTRPFFEAFVDEYETLAVVSQTALLTNAAGWRRNVQNPTRGIGLRLFDGSDDFGSAGPLQGIEVYPPGGWATARETLHQQAHQWGEYSRVWDELGIVRQGHSPGLHTPLLTPGAVLAGAVLEGTRRVAPSGSSGFRLERTVPGVTFHPLTLYRMGLIDVEDLPELRVFEDQGQFDPSDRSAPSPGIDLEGRELSVSGQDFLGSDGARSGPRVSRVRRALIYVSRGGLAPPDEMNVVNFYAARLEAAAGVTSWEGYPSFLEATGGRATMTTDVTPRPGLTPEGKVSPGPSTTLDVAVDALIGVRLDEAIPGRIAVGRPVTLSGTVTESADRSSNIACFRFIRYGSTDPNEVFVCSSLTARRFSIELTFAATQRGRYTVEPFLFGVDTVAPAATSRYGVVVVR